MQNEFLTAEQKRRPLDVTTIENALIDLLVKCDDHSLHNLGLNKGIMQLVEADIQDKILSRLTSHNPEIELGGSAANTIRGMRHLGSRVSYSSCVGNDIYGDKFSQRLDYLGIVNRVVRAKSTTGTCLVAVTPDGERTMNTHLGACRDYEKNYVPDQDIIQSKIFFTTGYIYDMPSQIEAIEHAFALAKKNNIKIAFDVADPFVIRRWGRVINSVIETNANIVFANAEEAYNLVGSKGESAALKLNEYVEIVVVKDGSNGAFIANNGQVIHIPACQTQVIDTTGAGDMFAAGFLYGLTNDLPLEVCGNIAALVAADTISYLGVRLSPDLSQKVQNLIK